MAEYNTDIYKQIEDVIHHKKETGEFDGVLQAIRNSRYAYSAPTGSWDDRLCYLDVPKSAYWNSEGDVICETPYNGHPIGPTDSEITVVRVKRENINVLDHCRENIESRIPGDGSYLLESPSLVNLVTLIGTQDHGMKHEQTDLIPNESYLVQLSSWETDTCITPPQLNITTNTKRKSLRLNRKKSNSPNKSGNQTLRKIAADLMRKIFFWRRVSVNQDVEQNLYNTQLNCNNVTKSDVTI